MFRFFFFNITLIFSALFFFNSCSKAIPDYSEESKIIAIWNEQDALRDFSIALSKVISTNESARVLLKNEAMRQFDNDYDVLFANASGMVVADGKTFAEMIQEALGETATVEDILSLVPTLTIYVTDITWLDPDGFRADRWDTSDRRVSVTYIGTGKECEKLYANGSFIGRIEPYTIPGGPVLIVKKNERVRAKANTRAGVNDNPYEFIADAFNPAMNNVDTKGSGLYYTGPYTTGWVPGETAGDHSPVVTASMLNSYNPDIITAYNLFLGNPNALPNDYIFYGMTGDGTPGHLNNNVRSKIVRFKIAPNSFDALFDDTVGANKDRKFSNSFSTDDNGQGYSAAPSTATIYSKLWSEGSLEINVKVFIASTDGTNQQFLNYYYDVTAHDLFTIKSNSIKKEQWGTTPIKWYITWRYSITNRNATTLVEKWYYPANSPYLPTWDLVNNSQFYLIISEHDSGATESKSFTVVTKKATTTTLKLNVEVPDFPVKAEIGWNLTDEESISEVTNVSWTNGNDEIIDLGISYRDKYIDYKISDDQWILKTYGDDRFSFCILPCTY